MPVLAQFDGLRLRTTDKLSDVETLDNWIAADDAHRGIYSPLFFMGGKMGADPRSSYYTLEDPQGVVFYIRLARAARVHIQFAPGDGSEQRQRNMNGLIKGMAFLEAQFGPVGVEEWIFDTESPRLREAAKKALGFVDSTHEMVRLITNPLRAEVI